MIYQRANKLLHRTAFTLRFKAAGELYVSRFNELERKNEKK